MQEVREGLAGAPLRPFCARAPPKTQAAVIIVLGLVPAVAALLDEAVSLEEQILIDQFVGAGVFRKYLVDGGVVVDVLRAALSFRKCQPPVPEGSMLFSQAQAMAQSSGLSLVF